MEKWEHYKKQTIRAAESALAEKRIVETRPTEHLATLFRSGESKFNRTVAMFSLMRVLAPFELTYKYNKENLAIDPEKYEFKEGTIGKGGENDVYLLESQIADRPSWVLKVNHQDRGNISELIARAGEIKRDYEKVRGWFETMPGLIPEEYTVIMEDPRDGKPAIITLQQYIGTHMRDVFRTLNTEDVKQLFDHNPDLKEEMVDFIRISEQKELETGEMLDLLGPKNLSFVETDNRDRLVVLDPHLISNPLRLKEETKKRQKDRLEFLKEKVGYGAWGMGRDRL